MDQYGIKYKCEFKSVKGLKYNVYILQRNYNSARIDMRMGGSPVQINYTSSSENKFEIIRGSECVLNIFSEYDSQFSEIMLADKNEFMVQVWLNDNLHWQGYVIQDNYSEPFLSAPYLISLRATDGLGDLKLLDFANASGSVFLNDMTFAESILSILALLKNGTELVTSIDVFEASIDRINASNESLNCLTVNPFIFLKNALNALKCDEVLKMILELFQCYIYYKQGKYYIERINYKVNESVTRRTYSINFDGVQSIGNVVSSASIRGEIKKNTDLMFINGDHTISYIPSYNKVSVDCDVIDPKNLIANNLFRFWDSASLIPFNWQKVGTLNIAKVDYPRSGSALRIDSKAEDAAINFSTNMLKPVKTSFQGLLTSADSIEIKLASYGNVRLMVKANTTSGAQYMTASGYTQDLTIKYDASFSTTPSTCKIARGTGDRADTSNPDGVWYSTTLTCDLPVNTQTIEFAFMPSYDTDKYTQGCIIREFTPTIKVSDESRDIGDNYSITTTKNNKETYGDFAPKLGEFAAKGVLNKILITKPTGKVDTVSWYRDGIAEQKALLEIAVRSIINQYRRPFRTFSGSFYGLFDVSKVYNIETLTGLFMPYKVSKDLIMDMNNVEFFELLPENDDSTDKYLRLSNYKDGDYTTASNLVGRIGRPVRGTSYN